MKQKRHDACHKYERDTQDFQIHASLSRIPSTMLPKRVYIGVYKGFGKVEHELPNSQFSFQKP